LADGISNREIYEETGDANLVLNFEPELPERGGSLG
jgi:hypothetical protein